jgi:hypothetical protein
MFSDIPAFGRRLPREIDAAKLDYLHHHAALDQIGDTLDQIGGECVPDFQSLDRHTVTPAER